MAQGDFKEALKKEGGCGLLVMGLGLAMFVTFIYYMIVGFNPEVKEMRNECYRREEAQYFPGDVPAYARDAIVAKCEREVRRRRGLPN
jgi:hypothetical protein